MNITDTTIQPVTGNSLRVRAARMSPQQRQSLHRDISSTVGQLFFGTLLQQFRATMATDNPLTGGSAGAVYRNQLDFELLSRVAGSNRFAIGDAIADQWLGASDQVQETIDAGQHD